MTRRGEKILLLDIETFPMLMYAWQAWEASALKIVEDTSIASFSAKWLHGKQTTLALCDYKGYKPESRDDGPLLADLWTLLDEAQVVVAHNLDGFDDKKITYRMMAHGMKPPSPYQRYDTLKEVKKVASFDSHKLNELCRLHEIGQKLRTGGKDLWFDCIEGKPAAWRRMKRYNARDTRLLEEYYLLLRPWSRRHPNLASLRLRSDACPRCGETALHARGYSRTTTGTYNKFQCQACGGWSRGTKAVSRVEITT